MSAPTRWNVVQCLSGGTVEIQMTPKQMGKCRKKCALFGRPECYWLPSKTSDWPKGKPIVPCDDCKEHEQNKNVSNR